MRRALTRLLVLALLGLSQATMIGAAHAATTTFTDPADSRYAPDIRSVTVDYADTVRVRVGHAGTPLSAYTTITYWLDTDPNNAGPEYYSAIVPNTDSQVLKRVSGFTDPTKTTVPCAGARATADRFSNGPLLLAVPAKCLNNPRRVRVSVRIREVYATRAFADWAPAKQQFLGWVRRG